MIAPEEKRRGSETADEERQDPGEGADRPRTASVSPLRQAAGEGLLRSRGARDRAVVRRQRLPVPGACRTVRRQSPAGKPKKLGEYVPTNSVQIIHSIQGRNIPVVPVARIDEVKKC